MRLPYLAIMSSLWGFFLASCGSLKNDDYQEFRNSQKHIMTPAGAMAYQDQGAGRPIILLHGVPTSSWMYRKVIPELSKKHRVIAVDLIGFGSSAKPQDQPGVYHPSEQAKRVRQLAKKLALSEYSLMFHDMGGLVAWEMLRQEPKAISNLIVLNTIIHKDGFNPPDLKPGIMTNILSKALAGRWTNNTALAVTFRSLGLSAGKRLNTFECAGYMQPLREGSAQALSQFYSSLQPALYERLAQNKSHLRKFKGETLILWGGKDKILTPQQIPFLTENLRVPAENIHIYPKHHHFLAEEAPREVVRRVTSFLNTGETQDTVQIHSAK